MNISCTARRTLRLQWPTLRKKSNMQQYLRMLPRWSGAPSVLPCKSATRPPTNPSKLQLFNYKLHKDLVNPEPSDPSRREMGFPNRCPIIRTMSAAWPGGSWMSLRRAGIALHMSALQFPGLTGSTTFISWLSRLKLR